MNVLPPLGAHHIISQHELNVIISDFTLVVIFDLVIQNV